MDNNTLQDVIREERTKNEISKLEKVKNLSIFGLGSQILLCSLVSYGVCKTNYTLETKILALGIMIGITIHHGLKLRAVNQEKEKLEDELNGKTR